MRTPLMLTTFVLAAAAGAAEIPAIIDADTTWTVADTPHLVLADVEIAEGVTVTVEPGVEVQLAAGRTIRVRGELRAVGSDDDPIRFVGHDPGDGAGRWGPLIFDDSSLDATFAEVDEYESGSILEHCEFEGAERALQLEAASPYVHLCTFRDNVIEDPDGQIGGAAIYIAPGSAPRVERCYFEANEVGGVAWGGAVYASFADPVIQDNRFYANDGPYGGGLCYDNVVSPVVGNEFEANTTIWEGGGATLYSASPAFLNNRLWDNVAVKDGGGIHVCIDCRPHANPLLMDNVIVDNSNAALGAGGIGAAYLRVFMDNELHGNTNDGAPSDFGWFNDKLDVLPTWVTHPAAPDNWWGTTDTAAIDEAIWDGNDVEGLGIVSYDPVRDGPVGSPIPRVTITTRELMYGQVDQPMPVFLTLYNPGPARDVELVLLLQLGEGPRTAYRGPLSFPGAEAVGGGYTLTLPTNAVWFSTELEVAYADPPPAGHAVWHAALLEPDTGERIGEVCSARFDLGDIEEVEE